MIEYINNTLQFDFIIDTYIPMIVKLFIPIFISLAFTIIFISVSDLLNGALQNILSFIGCVACIILMILIILLGVLIIIMPVLLCTIALKLYLMPIFENLSEIIIGILCAFICSSIFVISLDAFKKY